MTIYVVTKGKWDEYTPWGFFTTKEKAAGFIEKAKQVLAVRKTEGFYVSEISDMPNEVIEEYELDYEPEIK